MSLGTGFFALFPIFKKVRLNPRTRGQNCLRTRAHGRRRLMTRPWCLRRRRKRRRRRISRPSLSSLLSTCSTMGIGGVVSGTQLISVIAGGWLLPMGHRPAIRYGGLRGSSAAGLGDRSSSSVPAGIQRQVPAVLGLEVPQIQFIDSVWTFLLCLLRRLLTVQTVQMTVEILQLPFLDWLLTARYCAMPLALFTVVTVVDIPVVTQRLSFGPDCSENHSDSPDAVH